MDGERVRLTADYRAEISAPKWNHDRDTSRSTPSCAHNKVRRKTKITHSKLSTDSHGRNVYLNFTDDGRIESSVRDFQKSVNPGLSPRKIDIISGGVKVTGNNI
ncbi:hypothetical protein AVEN_227116-1 [Araneus ventricosus]|uniref:Uncharacterized protein n=1 Tax=Araneus ventricosus TaxID=182803 RepID=A0A4Y2BVT2_ARAVE|nr:hypothetical protein AVEN_227116-1 [Araneus ventricosus]